MVKTVTLTIDHKSVTVPEDTTILEAARKLNIHIPTLCYLKDINEIGACRICCVEVEGMARLVPACDNVVADGMVVFTNSAKAREARRMNLRLILSHHDTSCTNCTRSGNCTLQQLANDFNMRGTHFPKKLRHEPVDCSTPLIRENDKCVQCLRCIQVCERVQSVKIWDLLGTGSRTVVDASYNRRIQDTECTYCGQCITHCPTAALRERDDTGRVFDAIDDPNIITVVQVAPACGMGRAVRTFERFRDAGAHGRGAAGAWLPLCVRHGLCRRPHHHGGRQRIYRALYPQGTVSVADVHVLLPRLGALPQVAVSRNDWQSLHGQVAPADVRRGGEELLCRKDRH